MQSKDLLSRVSSLSSVFDNSGDLPIDGCLALDDRRSLKGLYLSYAQDKKIFDDFLENKKHNHLWLLILGSDLQQQVQLKSDSYPHIMGVYQTKDLPQTLAEVTKVFYDDDFGSRNILVDGRQMGSVDIDPTCEIAQNVFIGENTKIGARTKIHAGAVIMTGVEIGEDCEIFPQVTIYHDCKVGNRCRFHANTTIGADGFGYNFSNGVHHKLWHLGIVEIEDDVEIGASSAIDRATFGITKIGAGSKFDNHVQVAHNCQIGRGTILCGHAAIGGSCQLGDFTVMGGCSGMGPSISVESGTQIAGGALVNSSWSEPGIVLGGHPARPLKEWLKGMAYVRKMSLKK